MKCQLCSKPATVHFTKVVNKKTTELHLCQSCAEKQQIPSLGDLSLSAILQSLIGQHVGPLSERLSQLTCPTCGLRYMEFRKHGRLGCPADYSAFRLGLEPILQRVHRAVRHVGKVPKRGQAEDRNNELLQLRQQLRQAIHDEAFEQAAKLRDEIRQKDLRNEP